MLDQPDEIRRLGFSRPQGGTPASVILLTRSGYFNEEQPLLVAVAAAAQFPSQSDPPREFKLFAFDRRRGIGEASIMKPPTFAHAAMTALILVNAFAAVGALVTSLFRWG